MCQFFSAIVFRTGAIRFCEEDSHETIIRRMGLRDDVSEFTLPWVRVECVPPFNAVRVDETSTPGWYDAQRVEMDDRVMEIAKALATANAAYDKALAPANAAYDKALATANAAYDKALAPARAAYVDTIKTMEGYVPEAKR